jgi:alginate O-acetyltransferase complex protein AlgI
MGHAALSPNWQMTALFFLLLLPLCLVMKLVAFRGAPESRDWTLILAPFPSPVSVKRALPLSAGPRLACRFLVALAACIGAYWLYWSLWRSFRPPLILLSYAGAIVLWLVSETLGSLVPFLALPSGRLLPLPHGSSPPLAKSLSEFWGRRWNVWTSDWFRQMIFRPLQAHPVLALCAVFLASGIFHEWVINVPLYLVTGRNCFGSIVLYFLLQAFGILIERRTRNRGVRILLVWLFVFGAAPLMVNEGLLRILHLWPE